MSNHSSSHTPSNNDDNKITYFAETDSRNRRVPFGIKRKDRSRHMYVIGKTGMGKSTLLENMAIQDIKTGEGMAFIDPHGKTADLLLDYIPPERMKDVLYFAPFDMEFPVSFNVMEDVGHEKRHLVANGLMSAFKKIWVDAWSARMEYILNNILLALLEYPDATLIGVNRMLADKEYRKKVVDNITDPSVKAFWTEEFAKYGERYMQEAGAAIQNKIGQFISNPVIRNIIGQPRSTFDLRKMMDEKKILIMNLSKGRVGEANANLLGSMLITKIYLAAMSRADVTDSVLKTLPNFYLYVDEFQSFANESFADILSEARKYKLNLLMAHQYIEQMSDEVRAAVFGNVGTMVVFRVGAYDAEVLEKEFMPQFTAQDLVNLGFVQIYLKLMIDGVTSPPFSAVTLPPIAPPDHSYKQEIISCSRIAFARPREKVEDEIRQWHERPKIEAPYPRKDERPDAIASDRPREIAQQASVPHPVSRAPEERREEKFPRRDERPREALPRRDNRDERNREERDHANSREADLRRAISLSALKPAQGNSPKPEKKVANEKNVSALRDALSTIMKESGKGDLPSPAPQVPQMKETGESKKPEASNEAPPKQEKPVEKKEEPAIFKEQKKSEPAELPEDVLRKILKIE